MQECDTMTINFPTREDPTDVVLFLDDSGNPGFTLRPNRPDMDWQLELTEVAQLAQLKRQEMLNVLADLHLWLSAWEKQQATG